MLDVRRQPVQTALVPQQEGTVDQAADDEADPGPFQQPKSKDDRDQKHDEERDPRVRVADVPA